MVIINNTENWIMEYLLFYWNLFEFIFGCDCYDYEYIGYDCYNDCNDCERGYDSSVNIVAVMADYGCDKNMMLDLQIFDEKIVKIQKMLLLFSWCNIKG